MQCRLFINDHCMYNSDLMQPMRLKLTVPVSELLPAAEEVLLSYAVAHLF